MKACGTTRHCYLRSLSFCVFVFKKLKTKQHACGGTSNLSPLLEAIGKRSRTMLELQYKGERPTKRKILAEKVQMLVTSFYIMIRNACYLFTLERL